MAERMMYKVSGAGVTPGKYTTLAVARQQARARIEGQIYQGSRSTIRYGSAGEWATIETYVRGPDGRAVKLTGGKAPTKTRIRYKKRKPVAIMGRVV